MNSALSVGLLLLAGGAAGTINTVVGSGTLVTFPALLATGLSPLVANVTNTLGLSPGSFAGAYGYRAHLIGQRATAIRLGGASIAGAVFGAVLLLNLPAEAFKAIVPILIAVAVVLVLAGPRINRRLASRSIDATAGGRLRRSLYLATFATGVYGGYFGAAQGVVLMGVLGALHDDTVQRHNALKNFLTGLVNFVAAIVFIFTAHPIWKDAGIIAAGSIVGAILGARIGKKLSPALLRTVIVCVGIAAIVNVLR
jgi:uncharacterized membrane protein YfcA